MSVDVVPHVARAGFWTCQAVGLVAFGAMLSGSCCHAQDLPNAGGGPSRAMFGFTGLMFSVGECSLAVVGADFTCGMPEETKTRLLAINDAANQSLGGIQVFDTAADQGRSEVFDAAAGSDAGDLLLNFERAAATASPKTTFFPLSRAVTNAGSWPDACRDLLHVSAQVQVAASLSMYVAEASLNGWTRDGSSFGAISSLSLTADLGLNDAAVSDGDRLVLANGRHRVTPAR